MSGTWLPLSILGCHNKNTIHWVAYKQQKFIFQSSERREVQDKVLAHGVSGECPGPYLLIAVFLLCCHMVERITRVASKSIS